MIDLVALRSLVAVDSLGSVAAAADALGYTPSAVSQQVKRLEGQSGVRLLEKFGRGVMVTEAGRVLVADAADLMAQVESLTARLQASSGELTGHLRVGTFATALRGLVAPALEELGHTAPQVRVTLEELEPWDAVQSVAGGRTDLAVVHNWEPVPLAVPAHLRSRCLGADRADVLVHRAHPLADRSWVTPAALRDERWVSVAAGSICHQWLTRMLHGIGAEPDIAFFVQEFSGHVELVRRGLATALVPRLGRGVLPPEVVAVPVREPVPTRTVTVLWRQSMDPSPAVAAGVQALAAAGGVLR